MNKQDDLIYIYSFSKNLSGLYELYENSIFKQSSNTIYSDQMFLNKILTFDIKILGYDNQTIFLE